MAPAISENFFGGRVGISGHVRFGPIYVRFTPDSGRNRPPSHTGSFDPFQTLRVRLAERRDRKADLSVPVTGTSARVPWKSNPLPIANQRCPAERPKAMLDHTHVTVNLRLL